MEILILLALAAAIKMGLSTVVQPMIYLLLAYYNSGQLLKNLPTCSLHFHTGTTGNTPPPPSVLQTLLAQRGDVLPTEPGTPTLSLRGRRKLVLYGCESWQLKL